MNRPFVYTVDCGYNWQTQNDMVEWCCEAWCNKWAFIKLKKKDKSLPWGLPEWCAFPLFRNVGTGLGARMVTGGSKMSRYLETIRTEIK